VRGGGVYFVITIAGLKQTKERRGRTCPLHNWANLRFCAEIEGIFPARNSLIACRQRIKKICD